MSPKISQFHLAQIAVTGAGRPAFPGPARVADGTACSVAARSGGCR